jgi:hypothetical protein
MSIKRLFDAVERRGDIGRRVAALVLISNRPRVTSSCAGKIGLREPGEHTTGPNLASRNNVAHGMNSIERSSKGCHPLCPAEKQSHSGANDASSIARHRLETLNLTQTGPRRGRSGAPSGDGDHRRRWLRTKSPTGLPM